MSRVARLTLGLTLGLLLGFGGAAPSWSGASAGPEQVVDPTLTLDRAERGGAVRLSELGPGPYVVVPIFTRCRAVCDRVAEALEAAWGERGPEGAPAVPIVLVSFDPQDGPADMARFRGLFELPHTWHLATVEREEGLRFFSSLGFRWRTLAKRQFDHAGKIFVLTDELRIASVLGPDQLTTERLAAEIEAAGTGPSLARRIGTHWVGFFGVGVILLTLVVAVVWDKLRSGWTTTV